MRRLVRTELLKLATIRSFRWILVAGIAVTLFRFGMVVQGAGRIEAAPLGTGESTRALLLSAGTGSLLMLVFGILSVSTETRHGTIGWTFLATPGRWRVIGAKVLAVGAVAVAYVLVSVALVVGLTWLVLAREGIPFSAVNPELARVLAGAMTGLVLYAISGVGLGAMIRNQIAALLIPLGWLLIGENLLPSFGLLWLFAWMPGGATASLAQADLPGLLPVAGGALVLAAYATAAVGIGGRILATRDVA